MHQRRGVRWFLLALALALMAAACGDGGDGEDGTAADPDDEQPAGGDLIVGTTDSITSLDPARSYDYYSSNILFNAGQTLVGYEPGEVEVSPMLVEELPEISDDGLTYTFTLREGVTFHDGSTLDSEDVKFSLERAINMNHPQGAASLIAGIVSIDTPDEQTVVFTLDEPNITFLSRLAYSVATIVPSDGDYEAPEAVVEAEEEVEEGEPVAADEFVNEEFVGTGPYRVADVREGESITLEAFEDYWGDAPANSRVLVQFFQTSSQMKLALENGEIDIAYRDFSPEEQADLEGDDAVQVVQGDGASIRYIVLNVTRPPFDDVNVRKAIAASVERDRIVEDVFAGNAEELYSMIPTGFPEYQPHFEQYDGADPADFIDEPVTVDLWFGTEHYGPTESSLAQVLERSLEETGLFEVNVNSSEWAQFTAEAWPGEDGQYPAFLLGWYPDYFDADDYIEPFYESGGFLGMYDNPEMDQLVVDEQQQPDATSDERREIFDEIQQLAADDAPLIPLFQEVPFVFAQENVQGLEETMDPVQIFRYWLLSAEE